MHRTILFTTVRAIIGCTRLVQRNRRLPDPTTALIVATAMTLAACGGGGDDGAAAGVSPPAPGPSITLSGTAAVGALITGQPVSVKCAVGSASATTGSDGTYTVTIASGTWPCAAQVTTSTGTVLTTLATSSGTSAIANLTPTSHLVVAALIGPDPATWFQAFDAARAAAVTAASIAAAETRVVATLKAAGVDFSTLGSLLSVAYTNAYDNLLLSLGQRLTASGTTLEWLASQLGSGPVQASPILIASDLLLQPTAANCTALRSTTYRLLTPSGSAPLASQTSRLTVDAKTLQVGHANGTTGIWTPNGSCRYSEQTGSFAADVTITQAGVLIARYTSDGSTYRVMVGFPEQAHALAELAGDWNALGMSRLSSGAYAPSAGSLTYNGNGMLTAATNCQNTSTWAVDVCTTVPASALAGTVPLVADAAGGFDVTDPNTGTVTGRTFAFRAGSGDLMLASVDTGGELFFFAAAKAGALPAIGTTRVNWNFDQSAALQSVSAIYTTTTVVTAVDNANGSYARTQSSGSSVTRPETVVVNSPRTGYTRRPQATVVDSSGATVSVNGFSALQMFGMGFSPLILTNTSGTRLFNLSGLAP